MLRVKGLTCRYGSKVALTDIAFDVSAGSITGVVGPNGSGKTTLFRALSKVLPYAEGSISFLDRELSAYKPKELGRVMAVVPQTLPSPPITVRDYVAMGRLPHYAPLQFFGGPQDRSETEWAMERAGILTLADKTVDRLSGGEQRLVQLAGALAQKPKLLLLDEPVAHLDISRQSAVMRLAQNLNRELGLTLLIVLHDLNLAAALCRNLLLLHNGRVSSFGPPDQVLTRAHLREVYGLETEVGHDPANGRPHLFFRPEGE